jgi:ATP-dependent Clp protease ATP-binding subunit ClpX
MAKKDGTCSFCGASSSSVRMLIAGISGHICDNCAQQAYKIVEEELNFSSKSSPVDKKKRLKLLKPSGLPEKNTIQPVSLLVQRFHPVDCGFIWEYHY